MATKPDYSKLPKNPRTKMGNEKGRGKVKGPGVAWKEKSKKPKNKQRGKRKDGGAGG